MDKTKNILAHLKHIVEKNRAAFSNYNMVRMRETIRYLSPKKLEIFTKIPFLLHINSPQYPGFIDHKVLSHGIWNFESSGFYKEMVKSKIFPKLIIEDNRIQSPAILGFYHIGSLGTFTQSKGSDFDYWVIINKKKFSKDRYDNLEKKLDAVLKYSRENYGQKVSFFIMDKQDIKHNYYASFKGEETLTAPRFFLKEEFYRTFLMIAGKIPLWSVLPDHQVLKNHEHLNPEGIKRQTLSMYDDFIDLGQMDDIPPEDILKGLLWHICKSVSDPVKALIKATMIFSYGFGRTGSQDLLCEKMKQGYAKAGIDDYGVDPYKVLFDRILTFHETKDPKGTNLIKNAIFFRLCGYPDVKLPDPDTPKRYLLDTYIRTWKLNKIQVGKLLSHSSWPEQEKLLLEKTFIHRLAGMVNQVSREIGKTKDLFNTEKEKRNFDILMNKTRQRLRKDQQKIPECSTYLKRRDVSDLDIIKKDDLWAVNLLSEANEKFDQVYQHKILLNVLGWVLENQLYHRHKTNLTLDTSLKLFESVNKPVDPDKLYMAFQPLKPLSDNCYEPESSWKKLVILLVYDNNGIHRAEFLISNTWGELFFDAVMVDLKVGVEDQCRQIAERMVTYSDHDLRWFIYQLSHTHDPEIAYQLKKAYNDAEYIDGSPVPQKKKLYLDKL